MMCLQKALYRQYNPVISFSPWQELRPEITDIKSSKSIEQSTKLFLVSTIPLDRFHPILAFFNMGMM